MRTRLDSVTRREQIVTVRHSITPGSLHDLGLKMKMKMKMMMMMMMLRLSFLLCSGNPGAVYVFEPPSALCQPRASQDVVDAPSLLGIHG